MIAYARIPEWAKSFARSGGLIWVALVVFVLIGFAASANRFHANRANRAPLAHDASARIDYAFGPMAPEQDGVKAARLVPFRAVSSTGAIEVLDGMAERKLGDSVFKLRYADGSELWLVAVDK